MKANKDPKIEIKDCDKDYYHIEHTRIILDPTGKHPTTNKRIQPYDRKDYNKMFGPNRSPHASLGAMNDDEVRVVHDPVYQKELDDNSFAEAEKRRVAREKLDAKTEADKLKAEEASVKKEAKAEEDAKKSKDKAKAELIKEAEEKEAAEEKEIAEHNEKVEAEKKAKVKADAKEEADVKAEIEAEEKAKKKTDS